MRLGIIGRGVVGDALGKAFAPHVEEVRYYDILPEKATHSLDDTLRSDLIMICLPTPECEDSHACNTTALEIFFNYVKSKGFQNANMVIRSTVPVGFTRQMRQKYGLPNLIHSPEFLTARTAEHDAKNPVRIVHGLPHSLDRGSDCEGMLLRLEYRRYPGRRAAVLAGVQVKPPCHTITSEESEFLKLFQNTFSLIKIAAFNEAHLYASRLGLNWEWIRGALLAGGWINEAHTQVPGPDGKFGAGGACLPKDTANFAQCMSDAGLPPMMCVAALTRNRVDRERKK